MTKKAKNPLPPPLPAPDALHVWEIIGDGRADLFRCRVPGGWLYRVSHSDKLTFVMLPPEEAMLRMLQDGSFAEGMGNAFREILVRAAGEAGSCRKCGEVQPDLDGAKNCWKCGEPLPRRAE